MRSVDDSVAVKSSLGRSLSNLKLVIRRKSLEYEKKKGVEAESFFRVLSQFKHSCLYLRNLG